MRTSKDDLNLKVVVRRVARGPTPYQWEVREADALAPLHVSPGRFRGMEVAYKEGQAWLADLLASRSATVKKPLKQRPSKGDLPDRHPVPVAAALGPLKQQVADVPNLIADWLEAWRQKRSQSIA